MTGEHVIADEVVELANLALSKGENWMVYNQTLYFLDRDDIHFFKTKDEAKEFAENNISDRDNYHLLYFNSLLDIYKALPYGYQMEKELINNPDVNGLYNKEGNDFTDALIDHFEAQQS